MSSWDLSLRNTGHQPKLMGQHPTMVQNQFHSTLSFGGIIYPITPASRDRFNMFQNQKANSDSQPAPPVHTKVHAGLHKSSSPKVQHNSLSLDTKRVPPNSDVWTAVSDWLATSQTFEKPPKPASVTEAAPRPRPSKEHWLQLSKGLHLRIEARSKQPQAPIGSEYGYGNHAISRGLCDAPSPADELNRIPYEVLRVLTPKTIGLPKKRMRRTRSIEADISAVGEELGKQKRELEKQEQREAVEVTQAAEAAESKEADEAVRARETAERIETQKKKEKEDDDDAVKAKAKKLATDTMATFKRARERRMYVEERAREIHENMLLCKPFDVDAVRREFEEEEVRYVKDRVRGLGFAEKEGMDE